MSIFYAELIGTFLLVLLGNGVVANVLLNRSKGKDSGWIVITFGWGFAVALSVYAVGSVSGAHINPAVTIGFASIGKTSWSLVPFYLIGQIIGAFLGSVVVYLCYFKHFAITKGASTLLCFSTQPQIRSSFWNLVTEIIATMVLLFGILAIVDSRNQVDAGLSPYLIGMLIFSIGLSLGGPTGFAINPARDLGPRVAYSLLPIANKKPDWKYAYIPVVGPLLGGVIGSVLYVLFFGS